MADGAWNVQAVPLGGTFRFDERTMKWARHERDMARAREPARIDGRRRGRRRHGFERFPSRRRWSLVTWAHACCGGLVVHEKNKGGVWRCRKCGEATV